ncbi:MAG TPA: hypothetical protein VKE22_19925 [Haliangiales bacterium]|nr:hypothetical protein [Haliangiales bacterium]
MRPTLFMIALLSACAAPQARPAPFRARPDSVARGQLFGPFDGRVVDGDTQRPVTGALVQATWTFVSGFGMNAPAGYREWVGSTDTLGYYLIPALADAPSERLSDFHLVVYKKGYAAFRSDRRFEDFGPRADFAQTGYLVELTKWRDDLSHARHLRYVGGGAALAELTAWEVPAAAAELGGQKPALARAPVPGAAGQPALDADDLLLPADLKKATGFEGTFDVSNLQDEPSTPTYDSVHLQARGRDETFDVALRVWRLAPAEQKKQYQRLLDELPRVQERNEIGDRSLRATSEKGDILAAGYADDRRGLVVLIQCGVAQCRTHDVVLTLLRLMKDRADRKFAP